MDLNIRLKKITLTNFRNIEHAVVDIPGGKISDLLNGESSVLGIYGQNGSGKSSLLMSLSVLKVALSGGEFINPGFASCIRYGSDFTRLEFEFSAYNKAGTEYEIFYAFSLRRRNTEKALKENVDDISEYLRQSGYAKLVNDDFKTTIKNFSRPSVEIFDELVQYSSKTKTGKKTNKQVLIDTSDKACKSTGRSFGNKGKYEQLTAKATSDIHDKLNEAKIEAAIKSTSFIFADPVVGALVLSSKLSTHKKILKALNEYGENYLFVLTSLETAQNNMKILPLSIWTRFEDGNSVGIVYPLVLFDHCKVSEPYYHLIKAAIPPISNIVATVVPGLTIEISDAGKTTEDGIDFYTFDLFSVRNNIRIPLAYESEGTRKIIACISLLAAAYNNPSVTIAIDELDSGIFEFLLGELLSIIKESAKGQLIFTSHNLHPLDKKYLPYKNLLFTTTNPNNCFIKLEGYSGNNNLKDKYYSLIDPNSKNFNKDFYISTSREGIEQALEKAGEPLVFSE